MCPIRNHPFFQDIDWDKLERKELEPPYKPLVVITCQMLFSYRNLTTYKKVKKGQLLLFFSKLLLLFIAICQLFISENAYFVYCSKVMMILATLTLTTLTRQPDYPQTQIWESQFLKRILEALHSLLLKLSYLI